MKWFAHICMDMPCSQPAQTPLPDFRMELCSPTPNPQLEKWKRPKNYHSSYQKVPDPASLSYCTFLKGFRKSFLVAAELLQKLSFYLSPLTHHSLPHMLSPLLPFQRHGLTFCIPVSRHTGRSGWHLCKATLCRRWKIVEIQQHPNNWKKANLPSPNPGAT